MISTSGTYSFNPTGGDLITYAFSMIGIRRTELLVEHLFDARMALNLILSAWGNSTPNLWTVSNVVTNLVPGTATYDVDPSTVMILDAYIRTGSADDNTQYDRIIWPISRTEYASFPNKTLQAPPTVFWFDRLLSPTVTLWQVPDDQQPYQLVYYAAIAIQDADMSNGQNIDIPPLWMNALAYGLAAQLAVSYAPDRAVALTAAADKWLMEARTQNIENVSFYVLPMVRSYYPT